MNRDNWFYIPEAVFEELTIHEFTLFLHYVRICNRNGFCDKSNKELSVDTKIAPRSITRFKKILKEKGFIAVESQFYTEYPFGTGAQLADKVTIIEKGLN